MTIGLHVTWSLRGSVDLRSCWFRRRCPAGPLPYVHSPHLFCKLANPSGPELGCFPLIGIVGAKSRQDKYKYKNQVQNKPGIVRCKSRAWLLLDFWPAQRAPMVAVLAWVLACSHSVFSCPVQLNISARLGACLQFAKWVLPNYRILEYPIPAALLPHVTKSVSLHRCVGHTAWRPAWRTLSSSPKSAGRYLEVGPQSPKTSSL